LQSVQRVTFRDKVRRYYCKCAKLWMSIHFSVSRVPCCVGPATCPECPGRVVDPRPAGCNHRKADKKLPKDHLEWLHLRPCLFVFVWSQQNFQWLLMSYFEPPLPSLERKREQDWIYDWFKSFFWLWNELLDRVPPAMKHVVRFFRGFQTQWEVKSGNNADGVGVVWEGAQAWASDEILTGVGATSTFFSSLSGCRRCNSNVRSRNALHFLQDYITKKELHVTTIVTKKRLVGNYNQLYYNGFYKRLSAHFQSRVRHFAEVLPW